MKNTRQGVLKSLDITVYVTIFHLVSSGLFKVSGRIFLAVAKCQPVTPFSTDLGYHVGYRLVRFTQPRYAALTPHYAQHHFTGWWLSPTPLKI